MVEFVLPEVYSHPDGWGPPGENEFDGLPPDCFNAAYEHLDKYSAPRKERICDFTLAGLKYQEQRLAKGKGKAKGRLGLQPLNPGKDDEGYELVDSRPLPNKTFGRGRGLAGRGKGRGKGMPVNYQEGILGKNKKPTPMNMTKGKGKGKGVQQRRPVPNFNKEWSVQVQLDWEIKREINLEELRKLQVDGKAVEVEDVMWCGDMPTYNKEFDRLSVSKETPMKRYEDLNFFNITASDDPILSDTLQSDEEVTVIATDHTLACLIAAARSVYSWDLVISKIGGKLIIDKRHFSTVDFLSVNETADNPPSNEDKDSFNSPGKLSQEAGCINQNFSQMMLDERTPAKAMENPHPFEEECEGRAASGAYRYRKFTIPGNSKDPKEFNQNPVTLFVRTEVNCKLGDGKGQLCSLKALNEYEPKVNYSWRKHVENSRGMVLATELKNNGFKIGRWCAQAILSGCDVMKIGYASRIRPDDPWSHAILSVQTYYTDGFADQIGMGRNNVFGILRAIIDMVMEWDDGKYLLIKDPLKNVLRLFEVPWDAFQDEEEEEEEEEEEQELDEDGNVVPQQD